MSFSISFDDTKSRSDAYHLINGVLNPRRTNLVYFDEKCVKGDIHNPRLGKLLDFPIFNNFNSEHQITRYITNIAKRDLSLTHSMIPLGSCTMKLNSSYLFTNLFDKNWADIHPFQSMDQISGYTELIHSLERDLAEVTGLPYVSFQSNSGATGEYSALNCFRSYFKELDTLNTRRYILIPIVLTAQILLLLIYVDLL